MSYKDVEYEEGKLYLPTFALIPYEVLIDSDISDAAKIFFGELQALAHKHGYCWASDEALAEMKDVDMRTIQRWLAMLETKGHVLRETASITYRDKENNLLWKQARKIYIGTAVSKRNSDPDKNVGINDPDKNVRILKEESLREKSLKQETPVPCSNDSFLEKRDCKSFEKLELTSEERQLLLNRFAKLTLEEFDNACLACLQQIKANPSINERLIAYLTTLLNNRAIPNKSSEEIRQEKKDEGQAQSLNVKQKVLDTMSSVKLPETAFVKIFDAYISIRLPNSSPVFNLAYLDCGFWEQFTNFLRKCGIKALSD